MSRAHAAPAPTPQEDVMQITDRESTNRQWWRRAARTWTVGALALAASMGGVVAGVGPASGAEGDLGSDLVGSWKLD